MSDSFFLADGLAPKWPIRISVAIAQGLAGTIHHLVGEAGVIAKLYKEPKDLPEYREKIGAMLSAPPNLPTFSLDGRTYVQIAWPTASIIDGRGGFRGFVMPEVDRQASTELDNILQRSARLRKRLPEYYGFRVLLALNLAALMAELHALGHHMIDMKPSNMRFYPHAWYMAILDTDGFSINGKGRRMPARQFSDEYIAPDAKGMKPDQLGLEQDLFALAVIIFRLLDNGIHPYQGVDLGGSHHPNALQERIFAGLYAYGTTAHRNLGPTPSSIHGYLEDETRHFFDRAFQSGAARPTAAEWREHLNGLITRKVLVTCSVNPTDHAHFSKGCGLCALDQRRSVAKTARRTPVQSPASILSRLPTGPVGAVSLTTTQQRQTSTQIPTSTHVSSQRTEGTTKQALKIIAFCAIVLGGYVFYQNSTSETAPTTSPIAPAETAPISPIAPATISEAVLGTSINEDYKIANPTDTFTADTAKIYCAFAVEGIDGQTTIRSAWIAEDVGTIAPANFKIDEASLKVSEDSKGSFSLSKPNAGFPVGKYRVEIYIGDKLAKTIAFTVNSEKPPAIAPAEAPPAPEKDRVSTPQIAPVEAAPTAPAFLQSGSTGFFETLSDGSLRLMATSKIGTRVRNFGIQLSWVGASPGKSQIRVQLRRGSTVLDAYDVLDTRDMTTPRSEGEYQYRIPTLSLPPGPYTFVVSIDGREKAYPFLVSGGRPTFPSPQARAPNYSIPNIPSRVPEPNSAVQDAQKYLNMPRGR